MFSVRLALRSRNAGVFTCVSRASNNPRIYDPAKRTLTTIEREKIIEKSVVSPACRTTNFYSTRSEKPAKIRNDDETRKTQLHSSERIATDEAPKPENIFGDLNNQEYEKFEMDEDEKREERYVENEARVHRRYKLSPSGYVRQMKGHIQKGDLKSALQVLDLVKQNRDQDSPYMYNLLMRAHAVAGDFKTCRSLYAKMKKRRVKCNDATYTNVINACANYHHTETALDYLGELRAEFAEKNIILNETHYNTMIKAYGRHGNILEAFTVADEMRDKGLSTGEVTFNSLMIAAISDREAGLRHALVVWHQMRRHKIRPTVTTYNLMLRAIRDTKLGQLKVNDILIAGSSETQIVLDDKAPPNLLGRFPSVNSLVLTRIEGQVVDESPEETRTSSRITAGDSLVEENGEIVESSKKLVQQRERQMSLAERPGENGNLPAVLNSSEATIDSSPENPSVPAGLSNEEKRLAVARQRLLHHSLEKIHRKNRLILFGGVTGILERMSQDGLVPDTKSITLLMELIPLSTAAEQTLVKIARASKIHLDLDFYNMLMKKRSLRRDYDGAKEILDDIQRTGLCPDIVTWGVLAMGCQTSEEARTLMDGMKLTGHRLNAVIAGTLISIACKKIRFGYVLEIMETMKRQNVKPNWELYVTLDAFQREMEVMIKSKKFTRTTNHPAFKTGFSKFNCRYVAWQEEMGRKIPEKARQDKKKMENRNR